MKTKLKYTFIAITIIIGSKGFSQDNSPLFSNSSIKIYKSKVLFMNSIIYDANVDFEKLRQKEETDECKVHYSYYYNPLSLVGEYYSYEFGEGGVFGCGVPGSSLGVRTIDLNSNAEISLTDIFEEKSILQALKSDKWIQRIGKEMNVDVSKHNNLGELIDSINKFGYAHFNPSSFTILEYSEEKNEVVVRFVGVNYMGFNHNRHLQLGIRLVPKLNFKDKLLNENGFILGRFENGLPKNTLD